MNPLGNESGGFTLYSLTGLDKSLIIEKEMPMSKIAAQVGYDDYNYFTHLFKKRVGCSPLNYTTNLNNLD